MACTATDASAEDDVEVDGWRTLLRTDDEDPGSLGGSDRERGALVDEVLVPGEPLANVGRQSPVIFARLRPRSVHRDSGAHSSARHERGDIAYRLL